MLALRQHDNLAHQSFHDEIIRATRTASQAGRTFSGCGASARSPFDSGDGLPDGLEQSGYGNKTNAETKYKFDKKMHCVVCQTPPKKGDGKKDCGPCGICRTCDKRMSTKS